MRTLPRRFLQSAKADPRRRPDQGIAIRWRRRGRSGGFRQQVFAAISTNPLSSPFVEPINSLPLPQFEALTIRPHDRKTNGIGCHHFQATQQTQNSISNDPL